MVKHWREKMAANLKTRQKVSVTLRGSG